MAEASQIQNFRDKWKSISKMGRPKGQLPVNIGRPLSITTPEPVQEQFGHAVSNTVLNMRYLVYDHKPVCLMNGVLYAMFPIDDPSLGYKLVPGGYDQRLVMLNPRFINEVQAVRLLFAI